MQKRKFFVILSILIIIPLIGLSAQCGVNPEDKIDISEEEAATDETPIDSGDKDTSGSEDETDETDSEGEEDSEDEAGETDSDEGADEVDSEGDDTYIETKAPTITLKIYDGPTYSAADEVCYYRIEAEVTGTPSSTVTWSKDDSGGAWGSKKAQINLFGPSETYTLIATATNSEGSATDSMTLDWGCEEPETGLEPEEKGDEPGDRPPGPGPLWGSAAITASENMSGIIVAGETIRHGTSPIIIGDTVTGTAIKGYLSFDISGLHGKAVEYAEIRFLNIVRSNHPESFASSLIVTILNYGDSLDASDFALGGDNLATIPISAPSYIISGDTLIDQLYKALNDSNRDYFQLKLELNVTTNVDNVMDTVDIPDCSEEVWLFIDYWEGN